MDEIQKQLIEHSCAKLCIAYALRIDAYDYDRFIDLWSEDAVFDVFGREIIGHQDIRMFLDSREAGMISRHVVTNIEIEALDAETAKGTCYTIAYRVQNGLGLEPGPLLPPIFLVDCHSTFKRDATRGWVFTRRDLRATMAGEAQLLAIHGHPWAPRQLSGRTG